MSKDVRDLKGIVAHFTIAPGLLRSLNTSHATLHEALLVSLLYLEASSWLSRTKSEEEHQLG